MASHKDDGAGRDSAGRGARDRILDTAYELFSRHGIHAVGIDRIVRESNVAKMTLYRHFPSKRDLVLAFLDLREQRWTRQWLQAEVERQAETPRERLLAVFDVFDAWFQRRDYEGCPIINTMLEVDDENDPVHLEAVRQVNVVTALLETYARQAEINDPEETAHQLHILMMGSIMSARRGDRRAARRARQVAELVLERPLSGATSRRVA